MGSLEDHEDHDLDYDPDLGHDPRKFAVNHMARSISRFSLEDMPFYKHGLVPELAFKYEKNTEDCDEECRFSWLREQIVGSDVQLHTPFGSRILTYADYTASGRCVQQIEDFVADHVLPFYGNTHAEDSFVGQAMTQMVWEAAQYVKKCMGAADSEAIIFCGSGCTAALKRLQEVMGIAVPSILRNRLLNTLQDHERWLVFVGPFEHHSNLLSWRQSLAEVIEIPLNSDGLIDTDKLEKFLSDPKYAGRPKLGSFSACSNVTGILTDTRKIARILHDNGALACFDFASCGPYVKIDMRAGEPDGFDAIVLSPHKFVGGPGSPGILLMRKNLYLLGESPPSTAGGGVVDFVTGFTEQDTLYLRDIEAREDAGTPPIIQKIRAALAFWIKNKMGEESIDSKEESFITRAISRLSKNPRIMLLGNTKVKRAAILSFLIYSKTNLNPEEKCLECGYSEIPKVLQGRFIVKLLHDLFGIQSRGGCACAGPYGHALLNIDQKTSAKIRDSIQKGYGGIRPGWTRLNFAYFISEEEFEFILSAIEFVAEYGDRFVSLYDFDWVTGNWNIKKPVADQILAKNPIKTRKNTAIKESHAEYLRFAKEFAEGLEETESGREIPSDVDPDLVNFRI